MGHNVTLEWPISRLKWSLFLVLISTYLVVWEYSLMLFCLFS